MTLTIKLSAEFDSLSSYVAE